MTKPPHDAQPPRPSHARKTAARVLGWTLGSSVVVAAAAGPALAETKVQAELRDRYAVDEQFAVDLDLAGLELHGLSHALPDGRGHVRIEHVRVRPGFAGLRVELDGLDAVVQRSSAEPSKSPSSSPAPGKRASAAKRDAATSDDPISRLLRRLRGVPIEVVVDGRVTLEFGEGLEAVAINPGVHMPGDGEIEVDAAIELRGHATEGPAWAKAALRLHTSDADLHDLRVGGTLALARARDHSHTSSLRIAGHATREWIEVELHEPAGGRANLHVDRQREQGRDHARIESRDLPLQLLEPLAQLLGRRLGDALGEREGELDLDDARISGTIELVRGGYLTRARFDAVELSHVRIDSPLLSAKPIEIGLLGIDGELAREHTDAGPRSFASLVLAHAGVQLELSGQLDAHGLSFDAQLPTTSCQALLDATPGISPVLAGTVLSGQLDAHFGLDLDFAALEQARARYLGRDAEVLELEHFDAPGELRFSLPFLERCTVERLGSAADVEGLRGPYHHEFVSASGTESRRVLAVGDQEYVSIQAVPKLALAFVILEDARFWQHDGFDREQIERAFWFNLFEGRVSRGASTISQQTARSLWLGIDRSLTRKLAEAVLAAELERGLDKRRILEVYLNIIELGPEVHGVVEAARYHFGKRPEQLTLLEALHLASMAPAPVAYSRRFADGRVDRQWRAHLDLQIRRLKFRHLISAADAEAASRQSLRPQRHPELAPATHRAR